MDLNSCLVDPTAKSVERFGRAQVKDSAGAVIHIAENVYVDNDSCRVNLALPFDDAFYYFVHSYHVVPKDESAIVARCDHGGEFVAVVGQVQLLVSLRKHS